MKRHIVFSLFFPMLLHNAGHPAVSFGDELAARKIVLAQAAKAELSAAARSLPIGGQLLIEGVEIEGEGTNVLELKRFQVFTADAKILMDNNKMPPPDQAYYRGAVQGRPEQAAVLVVPASGKPHGLILGTQGIWGIGRQEGMAELAARKVEKAELAPLEGFRCGADALSTGKELDRGIADESALKALVNANAITYTAKVAVDTDYEFYALFNDPQAAASYVGALFAYVSGLYQNELATSLQVSYLKLWPGGAASDPWTVTSGTKLALDEFQAYWNANMASETRAVAHWLSGKRLGGGIAYVNALCDAFYGYGLSGSIKGGILDTSRTVWDTVVVAHEIGHNFGSRHTHAYCGIGGNASPIDLCYNGEGTCAGQTAVGLPGFGSLVGGTAGGGNGTIMSYCHLLSGGYDNLSMTFGTGFQHGVAAYRVPGVMLAALQSSAQEYPGCLDPVVSNPLLTVAKGGNGSGTVTSSPAGISCGGTCSAPFDVGQSVALTAVPASGSVFAGWSGVCSGPGSCMVTMDADKSVTAVFYSNGGLDAMAPWLPAALHPILH